MNLRGLLPIRIRNARMKATYRCACWLTIICLSLCASACKPFGNTIQVKVTSDNGSPVADASVTFHWTTNEPWGPSVRSGDRHSESAITDSHGVGSARIGAEASANIDVAHPSFYAASVWIENSGLSQHSTLATALPISLKRIVAPRPLVAKRAHIVLPSSSGEAAYDFLVGDLVAPYGKGLIADVKLVWTTPPTSSKIDKRGHYDMLFEMLGFGILAQRVSNNNIEVRSALRSDRVAPITGYSASMRGTETKAGFGERGAWGDEGIIYYLRVSRDGAPRYGKILGEPDIVFYTDNPRPVINFTYAINPSGDQSLEPDLNAVSFPKSNSYEQPYKLPETAD